MTLFRKRKPSKLPTVHIPSGLGNERSFGMLLGRALGWFLGWVAFCLLAWYIDQAWAVPIAIPARPAPIVAPRAPSPVRVTPTTPRTPSPAQVTPPAPTVTPEPHPWYLFWYPRSFVTPTRKCDERKEKREHQKGQP